MSFNMKTAKPYWTFAKAMKVTEDERHCCRIRKSERLIPMLPKYIGKLKTGIKEILDMEIGKYTEWVGGVLLGYSKVRLSPTSLPLDDQPVIPYNVHMDAIIFQPMIGKTLKCTVNEVAPDHIGCLALDYFNVSIPIPKTGSKAQDGQGVKNLQPGMHLLVEIRKIRNMHGIISIHGILQANLSGSTADKADSGILSGADEDIPMDTTPSDVDSVASIVMVPSNKMSSPPPVILSSSSSDLDTSMESLGSPKKKKKKKKKRKHSLDEINAAGVVKMESTSKADASRKKTKGKNHKNLCKEDKKEKEVPMDISEDDQTADTSVVKQELHSSASLQSLTSPSSSSSSSLSSKKKKKRKGLTKDDIDQIVNAKKEIPVVKQESSSSPSTPNSSFDLPSSRDLVSTSSAKKKKKKHKHSKKERPTIIKLEIPSDAEEETKDPSEKPTNSSMSSSSAKEKKHNKKTSKPSVTVKTEHSVETISGENSRTVASSAKSTKKHDKLKNLKSPVRGKSTVNTSSLPQSSTVISSSSSDGKKAKKRKHSKERSQSEVPIKKERGDDDPKKGKPDTSADMKTMLSTSEQSQHSKKKSHGNKSKIVKLEKNQKSNNKIMKKKIKVEKKAKHKKPKVKK